MILSELVTADLTFIFSFSQVVEMIHPDMAGVKKASIKTELAKKFKCQGQEERIAVFGLKLKFGGGRTTAFATIFDDLDARKKYDSKDNLRRVSSSDKPLECKQAKLDCLGAFGVFPFLLQYF